MLSAVMLSISGCTDGGTAEKAELLSVNNTREIDAMLETSPVFIEMGAGWCPSCVQQKPIVEDLAADYGDRVKFVYISTDEQPELATYFSVYYIPDLTMILKSDNGRYVYVTSYGTMTYDRQEAMMVGLTSKEVLEVRVQDAIRLREGSV